MKLAKSVWIATATLAFGAAHADTLSIDFDYLGPTYDYTAALTAPPGALTASPFLVSNLTTASSFVAFCIEPFVAVSPSAASPGGNSTYSSATPYNIAAVKALFNGYYTNSFTPVEAAAFQFAIWELVAETSLAPNLVTGSFAFTNAADPAVARGQQMLAGTLPTNAPGTAYNLFSYTTTNLGGDRSQNIVTALPVPEPGTYAMMAAGLALVGAVARRRKA